MIHQRQIQTILLLIAMGILLACQIRGCGSTVTAPPSTEPPPPTTAPPSTEPSIPDISSNVYVEYIFDCSGSMNQRDMDGSTRLEVALDVLGLRTRALPPSTNVGLRVYGHRLPSNDPQSCADIQLLVPVVSGGREQILAALPDLEAQGMTPMSESITHAVDDLPWHDPDAQCSIILISDGEETCGDDPCDVVDILVNEWNIDFTAHVIGYGVSDNPIALRQLRCIAEMTGGYFHEANSKQELLDALNDIWVQGIASAPPPEPTPTMTNVGDVIVRLRWGETADLDLYVTDPDDDTVYYKELTVDSGGQLDRDSNGYCKRPLTTNPAENIFWPTGGAPSGEYLAVVHYADECNSEGAVTFELLIKVDGDTVYNEEHTLDPGESFEYLFTR